MSEPGTKLELLPCRKCGGDAQMRGSRDGEVEWYQCRKCGHESHCRYTNAEAVAAWNNGEVRPAPRPREVAKATDPDQDAFIFEWFNERFTDSMAECIAAYAARQALSQAKGDAS